ncbi:MAG: SLC13 family permease [Bacillota bacterium]|nr:SLC13 family permease [Bacillota bacterium]
MSQIKSGLAVLEQRLSMEGIKWFILLLLAVFLFWPFYLRQPVLGIDGQGHWAISCIFITLAAWILHPVRLPRGVAAVLMMGLLLAGNLSYSDVFYGFTTSAIWIIIPAFLFGYVISQTGLGESITLRVLNRFGGNLLKMAFALVAVGIIFSILTPSTTVRIAIVMPIVYQVIKGLKLPAQSPESAFITLVAYTAAIIPGNGWLTGSLIGPFNMGLLPEVLRADLDWYNYSRAMIFPWLLIAVLLLLFLFLVFRPHRFAPVKSEAGVLRQISRQEISAAIVLSLCFLGYLTTPWHGLEAATITAFSLFLLFVTGTLTSQSISNGVNWEVVLFLGAIMSVTKVLESAGITALLGEKLYPVLMSFAGNVTLFIYCVIGLTLLLRFVDVAWGLPTVAVLFSFAPALASVGIHPIVLCFLNGVIQYFTFMHYMQPFAIISGNILEQRGWSDKHLALFGIGYILSVALSIVPAVWYWTWLGFF